MLENIQELFHSLMNMEPLAIALNVILFFAIFSFVFYLYTYEKTHKLIYRLNNNIKESFVEKEKTLEEEFAQLQIKNGNFEDKNTLRKVTKLLNESGLKTSFPELTAEMFLIVVAGIAILSCCIGAVLTKSVIAAIIFPIITVILIFLLLEQRRNSVNKAIEKELLKFIDLLINMSRTEGNLAEMFGGTIPYLSDPLKTMVTQCYYEMKTTGNTVKALNNFAEKANHKKIKEIVGYLLICAEKDESYENIIFEMKESVRSYIAFRNERDEIKKSGLVDLLFMAASGVVIVYVLSNMIPKTMEYLFHTFIGQSLIAVSAIILLYSIWMIAKVDN